MQIERIAIQVILATVVVAAGCGESGGPDDPDGSDVGDDGSVPDGTDDTWTGDAPADTDGNDGDHDTWTGDAPADTDGNDGTDDTSGSDVEPEAADVTDDDEVAEDAADATGTESYCGDGATDGLLGEECDDGNDVDNDDCSNDCIVVLPDLCTACTLDEQCARDEDLCSALPDGEFCTIDCSGGAGCPADFTCTAIMSGTTVIAEQCLPDPGVCSDCFDPDGDGYGLGAFCAGLDCDETDVSIHGGAIEICWDDIDNDCDGGVDESCGECDPADPTTCDDGVPCTIDVCEPDSTCSTTYDDSYCDDTLFCNGTEICAPSTSGSDMSGCLHGTDPCDDLDDCTTDTCVESSGSCGHSIRDLDDDGYADESCGGDDCDDAAASVNPAAAETCNGVDDDCDDVTDEAGNLYYPDDDGDGYGDSSSPPVEGCTDLPGHVQNNLDCNDADDEVFTGQSAWFITPISGTLSDFDFNCSGTDEERITRTGSCSSRCDPYFWTTTVPACGDTAPCRTCTRVGMSCTQSSFVTTCTMECH